jgi:ABC-2 type transporter
MYAAVLFMGISYSTSVQPVVAIERSVFYRERAAGMYSALPYAFGQVSFFFTFLFFFLFTRIVADSHKKITSIIHSSLPTKTPAD